MLDSTVALKSGKMPNWPMRGCQAVPVKNMYRFTSGRWKKTQASYTRTSTMPAVISTDNNPANRKKA